MYRPLQSQRYSALGSIESRLRSAATSIVWSSGRIDARGECLEWRYQILRWPAGADSRAAGVTLDSAFSAIVGPFVTFWMPVIPS